jgi:hypothetical protein
MLIWLLTIFLAARPQTTPIILNTVAGTASCQITIPDATLPFSWFTAAYTCTADTPTSDWTLTSGTMPDDLILDPQTGIVAQADLPPLDLSITDVE